MSGSYPHSIDHFPPIPALEFRLRRPDEGKPTEPLVALIDTGADITLVRSWGRLLSHCRSAHPHRHLAQIVGHAALLVAAMCDRHLSSSE